MFVLFSLTCYSWWNYNRDLLWVHLYVNYNRNPLWVHLYGWGKAWAMWLSSEEGSPLWSWSPAGEAVPWHGGLKNLCSEPRAGQPPTPHISHYSWKVVMEQNLLFFVCLGFVCVFLGWRGLSVMKQGEQILLNIRRKHLVTSAYVCANAT